MADRNPYAPPESHVASDSPADPKLLKQLLHAWPDDTQMLNKLRRLKSACVIVLIAATIYVTMALLDWLALNEFTLAIGVLGGIALGFTMHLELAFRQWPTLKKYFDWERMRRDHEDNGNV
jgi:hypothetical protein